MPKLRPNPTEEARRVVRSCISASMELHDVDDELLAAKIGVKSRTVKIRRENPENFTLGDLWSMNKTLKLTPIQAASIVLGRPLTSKEIKEFILM